MFVAGSGGVKALPQLDHGKPKDFCDNLLHPFISLCGSSTEGLAVDLNLQLSQCCRRLEVKKRPRFFNFLNGQVNPFLSVSFIVIAFAILGVACEPIIYFLTLLVW